MSIENMPIYIPFSVKDIQVLSTPDPNIVSVVSSSWTDRLAPFIDFDQYVYIGYDEYIVTGVSKSKLPDHSDRITWTLTKTGRTVESEFPRIEPVPESGDDTEGDTEITKDNEAEEIHKTE